MPPARAATHGGLPRASGLLLLLVALAARSEAKGEGATGGADPGPPPSVYISMLTR